MKTVSNCTIRDLVRRFPNTRSVLDRYGLKGCGGPEGPAESLRFFARAHGVELSTLLRELQDAVDKPEEISAPPAADPADTIYRRFFKAGIAVTLTAGAVWGALLLITIGLKGSFTAISIFDINAHGHAQIFGWVGLFVMGFAYQAFPRFKHTALWNPRLALLTFDLMLAGLILRVIGEPLHRFTPVFWLAVLGTVLEVVAISLFNVIIAATFRRSQNPFMPYDYYIGAAFFWFLAQAVLDLFHLYMTSAAPTKMALLAQVATWQAPLRDLQIHGFALTLILGVSQRFLLGMFGFPEISRCRAMGALAPLTAAVAGEALFFVLFRTTGQYLYAGLMYACMVTIAVSVVVLTCGWWTHLWGRPAGMPEEIASDRTDRSFKFIQAAYAWLYLSLAMLLFVPFYNRLTGQAFSHAFYGATRHAITVGFISMMILGVAAKVVPVLNGVDAHALSRLWLPFVLVNTGCLLRVSTQILTDLAPGAFSVIGLSGVLEVTGIAAWGIGLYRVMNRASSANERVGRRLPRPVSVDGEDKPGLVVDAAPELLKVFAQFGFAPLQNPLLRRTLARQISIRQACRMHGVDEKELLAALNAALSGDRFQSHPFPILNAPGIPEPSHRP
jgi:Domain of unknown function (DUF1858)/NnrS protein